MNVFCRMIFIWKKTEILNSIGMAQAITDRDRAQISLSYHCVSLTDLYWVKESCEDISYEKINLYDHSLNEAIVQLSLRGKPMTVTNQELLASKICQCFDFRQVKYREGFYDGQKVTESKIITSKQLGCPRLQVRRALSGG